MNKDNEHFFVGDFIKLLYSSHDEDTKLEMIVWFMYNNNLRGIPELIEFFKTYHFEKWMDGAIMIFSITGDSWGYHHHDGLKEAVEQSGLNLSKDSAKMSHFIAEYEKIGKQKNDPLATAS